MSFTFHCQPPLSLSREVNALYYIQQQTDAPPCIEPPCSLPPQVFSKAYPCCQIIQPLDCNKDVGDLLIDVNTNFQLLDIHVCNLESAAVGWNDAFTVVAENSGRWNDAADAVELGKDCWDSTYSTVKALSCYWLQPISVMYPTPVFDVDIPTITQFVQNNFPIEWEVPGEEGCKAANYMVGQQLWIYIPQFLDTFNIYEDNDSCLSEYDADCVLDWIRIRHDARAGGDAEVSVKYTLTCDNIDSGCSDVTLSGQQHHELENYSVSESRDVKLNLGNRQSSAHPNYQHFDPCEELESYDHINKTDQGNWGNDNSDLQIGGSGCGGAKTGTSQQLNKDEDITVRSNVDLLDVKMHPIVTIHPCDLQVTLCGRDRFIQKYWGYNYCVTAEGGDPQWKFLGPLSGNPTDNVIPCSVDGIPCPDYADKPCDNTVNTRKIIAHPPSNHGESWITDPDDPRLDEASHYIERDCMKGQ